MRFSFGDSERNDYAEQESSLQESFSAVTSAEIMHMRRIKSQSSVPADAISRSSAERRGSSGAETKVMQHLEDLDAKADQSLEFLKKLSTMVSESATRIEQMQSGGFLGPPRASEKRTSERRKISKTTSFMDTQLLTHERRKTSKADSTSADTHISQMVRQITPSLGVDCGIDMPARRNTDSVSSAQSTSSRKSYQTHISMASEMISKVFRRTRDRSMLALSIWNIMNENLVYIRLMRTVVLISVLVSLMHTADEGLLTRPMSMSLSVADVCFDAMFLFEISIRFGTCPSRIAFCYNPFNLLDVCASFVPLVCRAIAGFSIPTESGNAFSMRTFLLCGVPILRICKLLRFFSTFHLLLKAFRLAFEALPVLLFTLSILVLFFSTLIYMAEPRSNIESYPRALWLTIITTSTVGYGDAVPETVAGYICVSCLTICSALYMAIPIGIVGNAFSIVWQDRDRLLLTKRARDRLVSTGYSASDVPMLFHAFDKDNDGHLNLREFSRMITSMDIGIDDERILDLYKLFDPSAKVGIDDESFVRNLFPESYAKIYLLAIRRASTTFDEDSENERAPEEHDVPDRKSATDETPSNIMSV